MKSLRTKKTEEGYAKFIKSGFLSEDCNLCNKKKTKSIREFKHWRIVKNIFPYDRIAKINDMLVSKRHTIDEKLTGAERKELNLLKRKYIDKNYEFIIEGTFKKKSIPEHFHVQLIVVKS